MPGEPPRRCGDHWIGPEEPPPPNNDRNHIKSPQNNDRNHAKSPPNNDRNHIKSQPNNDKNHKKLPLTNDRNHMKPPPYNSVKTSTTNELIKKLNFTNFTTIYIKVLQRILISLDGTDISERGSLMWEEARVLGENPVIYMHDQI